MITLKSLVLMTCPVIGIGTVTQTVEPVRKAVHRVTAPAKKSSGVRHTPAPVLAPPCPPAAFIAQPIPAPAPAPAEPMPVFSELAGSLQVGQPWTGFDLPPMVWPQTGWRPDGPTTTPPGPVVPPPAVPEPATWALLISGFALLGAMLRRAARMKVQFV